MSKKKTALFILTALLLAVAAIPSCKTNTLAYNGKDAVIKGEDGYLFRAFGQSSTELSDFCGEDLYGDDALDNVVGALSEISDALLSRGCKTVFVLVPSKMAIYRDKLPENVKKDYSSSRKYTQLRSALLSAGLDVTDLTELFERVKDGEQLYDTAADTLNDAGGYRVAEAAITALNEKYRENKAEIKVPAKADYTVETAEDETHALTREYRNITGETVPNRTVTYKENSVKYEDAGYDYEATYATEIPYADREVGYGHPSLLVLDTGNSVSSRKFFSAVTSLSVFRRGIVADETVLERAKPEYAVIIINENELSSLPSNKKPIETVSGTSAAPVVNATAYSDKDRFVIFGSCEKNSTITATGGTKEVTARSYGGEFVIEVPIRDTPAESRISLYCTADGKEQSEAVTISAKYSKRNGYKDVVIGKEGHLHYQETVGDFTGETLWPDETVQQYVSYLNAKADRIHAVSPNTKIIYVIAPNHLTIYPETAPDELQAKKCDDSRLKQLIKAFENNEKLTFLDLITPLMNAKETAPYRLYNRTDTHWNELGAYYAYREIMNAAAKDFPAAAPDPLDSFNVFTKTVAGGDMANFLDVDLNVVTEEGVYVRSKTELKSGISKDYSMNFANAWFSDYHEFKINDSNLPTMIMYRDSFSTNLMSFMAEKFSYSVFYTMWERPDDLDAIAEMKPDYIIYEFVERSLGGLQ